MELSDLVGKHVLDAVDTCVEKVVGFSGPDDSNQIYFRLDGIVYVASEDPEDGYRSCMKDIKVSVCDMKNVFRPVAVTAVLLGSNDDLLQVIDDLTGLVVLEIGTDNSADYYPAFRDNFYPQHMATNSSIRIPSPPPPKINASMRPRRNIKIKRDETP